MNTHPLPIGTRIRTLGGAAQGDRDVDGDVDDDGEEIWRETVPGEIGRVIHRPDHNESQGWMYSVEFSPSNVWVFLDQADVDDPTKYEVLLSI